METPKSLLASAAGIPLESIFTVQHSLPEMPDHPSAWGIRTLDGQWVSAPVMTKEQAELIKTALNSFFHR